MEYHSVYNRLVKFLGFRIEGGKKISEFSCLNHEAVQMLHSPTCTQTSHIPLNYIIQFNEIIEAHLSDDSYGFLFGRKACKWTVSEMSPNAIKITASGIISSIDHLKV